MEYTANMDYFLRAQQNQARSGNLPPPQAVPLLSSSRSYDQFLNSGGLEPPSGTLYSIPEDGQLTDQGRGHPRNPSVFNPEKPPAKKQRVQCEGCNETLGAKKSLKRHRETCEEYCAKIGISPKSYRCDECSLEAKRSDTLHRHVQTIHRGQPRKKQKGSKITTQQSSPDVAQEPQGSEHQRHTISITTTRRWDDSSFALAGRDLTECYASMVSYSGTSENIHSELRTHGEQTETYSHVIAVPASVPDSKSPEHATASSEYGWTSNQNSNTYQGTHSSAPSDKMTPATYKPSPASIVIEVATEVGHDEYDDDGLAALANRLLNVHDVPSLGVNQISQGRSLRPNRIRFTKPCPLCGYELSRSPIDNGDVGAHIGRHIKRMQAIESNTVSDSEATCTVCQIDFLDSRDLRRHQESARLRSGQSCGFSFEHVKRACTGHHPPTIDGQVNPEHGRFKNFLREWEGLQRRAFKELVDAHSKGTAPTNVSSNIEIPRSIAIDENFEARSKELALFSGPSAFRKTTGSSPWAKCFASTNKHFSAPVRFNDGRGMTPRSIPVTRNAPDTGSLASRLENAMMDGDYPLVRSICSENRQFFLYSIPSSELSHAFSEQRDSWSFSEFSHLEIERVRCLAALVEHGLQVSTCDVERLTSALAGPAAVPLLFAENSPLTVQSRLVHCAFLHAVSQGRSELVSKLLKSGILDTTYEMLDLAFIQELHTSRRRALDWIYDDSAFGLIAESSGSLGSCALVLALSKHQHHVASLLLEHHVEPSWGSSLLSIQESSRHSLNKKIRGFRLRREPLPHYLEVLLDVLK